MKKDENVFKKRVNSGDSDEIYEKSISAMDCRVFSQLQNFT